MLNKRRPTREVRIGNITIGGNAPIAVQSMANVPTRDIDRCLSQIEKMVGAGCEMVRLAVPGREDTAVLAKILAQVAVPVIADVHFHFERALESIEAGVAKIRLNPGNINEPDEVEQVIDACRANGVAIRVGVNQGSVRPRRRVTALSGGGTIGSDQDNICPGNNGHVTKLMVDKLTDYVRIFEDKGFDNLVLSAKCHDASGCINVYRAVSEKFDYPLHLGVTHAGTIQTGAIRSAAAMGTLLAEGIGDTLRVSLAGDPVAEIDTAWEILTTLGLRQRFRPELIACPTCGRTEIDVLGMVEQVKMELDSIHHPVTVAVMGCVVNGPGEAAEADVALCGGRERAAIYRQGRFVCSVPAESAVEALLDQVKLFINERQ